LSYGRVVVIIDVLLSLFNRKTREERLTGRIPS